MCLPQSPILGRLPAADRRSQRSAPSPLPLHPHCPVLCCHSSLSRPSPSRASTAVIANRADDDAGDVTSAFTAAPIPAPVSPSSLPPHLSRSAAWRLQSSLTPLASAVWLQSEVVGYLSRYPAATQSRPAISACLTSLHALLQRQRLHLTGAELLQLVNLRPLTLVEVHRVVEECEERMGEADILTLLDVIREHLPEGPNQRRREEAAQQSMDDGVGDGQSADDHQDTEEKQMAVAKSEEAEVE